MMSIFIALALTLIISFIPEWFLKPRPHLPRSIVSIAIHVLTLNFIFNSIFLLIQRPYFSGLVALGTLCVFVIVSNAKFKTLREPLVFSDIAMFSQAFKHPRLYLPFLGIVPAITAPIIASALIFLVIKYEPAIALSLWSGLSLVFVLAVSMWMIRVFSLKLELAQDPSTDIKKYGLLASLWGYSWQAQTSQHKDQIRAVLLSSPMRRSVVEEVTKPHVITIQSESFFDARRLHPSIKTSLLKNFDQLCHESKLSGRLNVPAWGANTMRTEFSVLTGIPSHKLGLYRFYPYQYLANESIPSLASYYQQQGYYCVCIHPHPASFFGRDRIFPKMGFDEFIDIASFNKNDTFGPYIKDAAVTKKIIETLDKQGKPVFIFAITMENHGPLHLEKTTEADIARLYDDTPPQPHNDLTVYLRHLKNADDTLGELSTELKQISKEAVLCLYGDHIPSMPDVYKATGYENDQTDYFIWHNKGSADTVKKELSAEQLAEHLISY